MKNTIKILLVTASVALVTACGGGGGSGEQQSNTGEVKQPVYVGYYPAKNGSGYAEFYDLTMPLDGYLDITTFKSSLALYGADLVVIDPTLESTDYIPKGNYKVKISYEATALLPGNATVFSLALTQFGDIPNVESKQYSARGDYGTYSEYYKLNLPNGGNVDVAGSKSSVYAFNYSKNGALNKSMIDNYSQISGNQTLEPGSYIIKFTYQATSLTPGTVSFFYSSK